MKKAAFALTKGVRLTPRGRGVRVAIVRAAFNDAVVAGLADGAQSALLAAGVAASSIAVFVAPGAFELPLLAQAVARSKRFDAVVALGAVIRGDTDHYEHICRAATDGLARVALDTGVPVGFGVLTAHDIRQAQARSVPGAANKGAEAARAALHMVESLRATARAGR